MIYPIVPMGKPRMTRSDKWKKRPEVMRYRAFRDEVRIRGVVLPAAGAHITFILPMPASWSKKKRAEMNGKPHQVKPDKDNLEKALLDALFENDAHIWDSRVTKLWGESGQIIIEEDALCAFS
ncbi:RusA family crossover junction endodeoxyribonuclease [Kosakonia oryzae]|uniref:Holliday junction resolvase RusA (Prophage-encoded endonuclease) n=1 Tax=Kosakonia oryzae TaxID=497725 RepID=A0AA94H4A7_9ENTR|nr:RusA family crossover junction endodeoxyribonuclease [Kosakonia oryzae]ANI82395.1 RusA family crossover junction endodeoxyribonuclease [Kosakonia oryzae]SFC56729.1 Holliday junction resolvase RusA (prophage-encoded endonuclease) [Kosakonia oryzae]